MQKQILLSSLHSSSSSSSLPSSPFLAPALPDYMQVTKDDFETITLLGEGGYGKVTLVRKKDTRKVYAMKVLDKSKFRSQKAIEHLMTEKRVLVNDSPFLLHLQYSFQSATKLYMVTDFMAGGDMFFHLAKRRGRGFTVPVTRFFVAEITLALEHLHSAGVVYR